MANYEQHVKNKNLSSLAGIGLIVGLLAFLYCLAIIMNALQHRFGLSYDTFMPQADALADFIRQAHDDGLDILCQCDYGQSRSAACCAAILEHYERRGIEIFADYRYYPNQVVFNRVREALACADAME